MVKLVEPEDCVPVEHCLVTFTTGSTGMPKLMLRRHRYNVWASISRVYCATDTLSYFL